MPSVSSVGLALLSIAMALPALSQERPASVRLLVQSSPLAGFRHYAAADVWHEMRVGDRLELLRESENPHDATAVMVAWRGRKVGYVPRRDNAALAWGLDRGEHLQARISGLVHHPNPARRIRFEVFIE